MSFRRIPQRRGFEFVAKGIHFDHRVPGTHQKTNGDHS